MNLWVRSFLLTLMITSIIASILYLEGLKPSKTTGPNEFSTNAYKDWVDPSAFLNSEAFALKDIVGEKIILLDFWTYSCINCQRTQPFLNEWWDKYKEQGLLIVGIHTPEFEFEKDQNNVEAALKQLGIKYPVVMDNNRGTWNAYGNRYWPRKYLIDLDGKIIYDHIGEGNYEETETEIQKALGLSSTGMSKPENTVEVNYEKIASPETYFGSNRDENINFVTVEPMSQSPNEAYVIGTWTQAEEYIESGSSAAVSFEYNAKNVYMVASATMPTEVEIWLDEELFQTLTIEANGLYHLVEGDDYGKHQLKIIPKKSGCKLFTLSFG